MKHQHAELMLEYAQDWAETEFPWQRWEVKNSAGSWIDITWHPRWQIDCQYRRKPKRYEPTLLDQALELEIEAAEKKSTHFGGNAYFGIINKQLANDLRLQRSIAMIEHLKSQGKL